ncbi:hypothetical protein AB3S75_043316 [Citrus x aurantiifolia]
MSEESENVKDEMVDSEDCVEISKRLFAQKSSKWNCKFGASLENSKVKYKCDPGSKKREEEELAEKNESDEFESDEFDLCDSLGEMGIRVTKRRRISAEGRKRAIRIATSWLSCSQVTKIMRMFHRNLLMSFLVEMPNLSKCKYLMKQRGLCLSDGDIRGVSFYQRDGLNFRRTRNWLKEICVFQLIRKEDVLLKLSIFCA